MSQQPDENSPPPAGAAYWCALGAIIAAGVAYWAALSPMEINGDGVGYLKALQSKELVPGHILYLPVIRLLVSLAQPTTALDAVPLLRALSFFATALSVLLLADALRRLQPHNLSASLFAAAFCCASYGLCRSAHQVESYALTTCALTLALWATLRHALRPRLGWAALASVAAGLAALLHISLVLLALPIVVGAWRQSGRDYRHGLVAGAVFGAVVCAGLGWAIANRHLGNLDAIFGWLRNADHGIPYPLRPWTPLVALWGFARSFVFAPYPYEAGNASLAAFSSLSGAALLGLLASFRRRDQSAAVSLVGLDRLAVALWVGPLALLGLLFYPSDTERWVFVWPLLALLLAPRARRLQYGLVALALLVNAFALLPAATSSAGVRRARSAERQLRPSDLVIGPGHGWTEQLGLGMPVPPNTFPLLFFVGESRSLAAAEQKLRALIASELKDGHRVYLSRLSDDTDPRGFKELARFGLSRERYAQLFAGCKLHPLPALGLHRLLSCAPVRRAPGP